MFGQDRAVFPTFADFAKKLNSLELLNNIFENSSPKGSFGRNKRKFEFSVLSRDSRKIQSDASLSVNCLIIRLLILKLQPNPLKCISLQKHESPLFKIKFPPSKMPCKLFLNVSASKPTLASTSLILRDHPEKIFHSLSVHCTIKDVFTY